MEQQEFFTLIEGENMNKSKWMGYIAGILFGSSLRSLHQDIIGKERYLNLINYGWVDSYITVPIAGVMILIAVALMMEKD
jgi:hypothetical protein